MSPPVWVCRGRRFEFAARPLVLGIVNVTPDSFSDSGRYDESAPAVDHALRLVQAGADMLDVGGESTRPGSLPVTLEVERRRVIPVVRELAKRTAAPISVDTSKAEIARQALDAGASVVNDVTGLRGDPEMTSLVARTGAGVIVMHMQGTPADMQANPHYDDVVREVSEFFADRLRELTGLGVPPESVCLDPGIGFGKSIDHNLDLLANLDDLRRHGRPICLGVSRKGFIGKLCGREVGDRMAGSVAVASFAAADQTAHVLRVHDVAATRDAVVLLEAIRRHRRPGVMP